MERSREEQLDRSFRVSLPAHLFGGLVHGFRDLWVRLGDLETRVLRERLEAVTIDRPIYIAGLARSGTTILLELLAGHREVVTHRYRDFPPVFTPFWWQEIVRRGPNAPATATERAHGDGIAVGPDSPEAMEEPIWMAFFPECHERGRNQVLDGRTKHAEFEQFYCDHLRKLLLSREGRRYVSKGNYNVTRLEYLLTMFSDARLIVPIRHPRGHIASLMKQQKLFAEGESRHPRALAYMQRVGHFEFGLDRRAIEAGSPDTVASVYELWKSGQEARGWARYWAALYGWLADRLEADAALREATLVVRYEDLCDRPRATLSGVLSHAALQDDGILAASERVHAPSYYRASFSREEEDAITEETSAVAERYGYARGDAPATAGVIAATVQNVM